MYRTTQAIRTALDSLGANPLRTLLSTLGVIIGVASLVAILALGDGLERYSRDQIAGTTDLRTVMVTPGTTRLEDGVRVRVADVPTLDRASGAELGSRLGDRAAVARLVTASGWASVPGDTTRRAVLLTATEPAAEAQLAEPLLAGRFFRASELAAEARAVVVPSSVAGWYGLSPSRLVGRMLELDGRAWEVVGVWPGGTGSPTRLIVPLSDARGRAFERPDRRVGLAIRAARVEAVESVTAEVEAWLAERWGSASRFRVESNRVRVAQARQAMWVFKLVMGAIAGIALLVGGIGIMNILLASVVERTREIGIRKATGARQRDIRLQFLAEAVTITGAGSVLGVVVGVVGAFVITAAVRRLTEAPVFAAFTWGSVLVAAAAALLVGLAFGTYPARRAARLSPIEAIRHE